MIDSVHLLEVWVAAMWRASWQGGLVALAVASVCRLAPTMPSRFQSWLWRLVVLKFLVALIWLAPIEVPLLPAPTLPTSTLVASSRAPWESSVSPLSNSLPAEGILVDEHPPSSFVTPWLILFFVWIVFIGWQAARILTACRNANRLRNGCRLSENRKLIEELAKLSKSAGLSSPPMLLETDGQGSPLLLGIFRPAIVLPVTTLSRLDASERALVISHELAHLRRADLLWSVVAAVARGVFFFHPLVWLSEQQLRLTQEIAADELAIALQKHDPVSYATMLVSVISKLGPARLIPTMSVGMAGSQPSLKQRFSAMRFMKPVSRRIVMTYGIVLGLVAVPAIVPWAVVAADPPAADKPSVAYILRSKEGMTVRGKFVSFKGDLLKIKGDDGVNKGNEIGIKVAGNIKVVGIIKGIKVESTGPEAFKVWEPGAVIAVRVEDGMAKFVEIGTGKATDAPAADKPLPENKSLTPEKGAREEGRSFRGKFVLFKEKEGVLRMKGDDGKEFDGIKVAEGTPVVSVIEGKEVKGSAPEAFRRWDAGADIAVRINDGKATFVRIKAADKAPDRVPQKEEGKQIQLRQRPESDRVAEKAAEKVGQKNSREWGKFVSFQDGTLTFNSVTGDVIKNKIPGNSKSLVWNNDEGAYQQQSTVEALKRAQAGTFVVVADGVNVTHIGAKKGKAVGTFVSFKDDRLLMLGKHLPESFTKKYGDNLHFKKFAETIPVYESIDGGKSKLIGTPGKVLGSVKEGTVITVHSEGDENFTHIELGVSKK